MRAPRLLPTAPAHRPRMVGGQTYWVQPLCGPDPGRPAQWPFTGGLDEAIRTSPIAVHAQAEAAVPAEREPV